MTKQSHCKHCDHQNMNHGKKNGCSVCRHELDELEDRFCKEDESRIMMPQKKRLTEWRKWVKKQGIDSESMLNHEICMKFDMLWYGGVSKDSRILGWKDYEPIYDESSSLVRIEMSEVPIDRAVEILTEQLRIMQEKKLT